MQLNTENLRVQPAISPSQWAEQYRILPASMSAEPGPWHNARTPYLAAVMDAVANPAVDTIVVQKAAQVGFSECFRNVIGWMIMQQPGPLLLVLPSEQSARDVVEERILPLLRTTPALQPYLTDSPWDMKINALKLTTMSIYIGWAGSPASLASRPIRYVICDEVDKYPPYSGREADPIRLAIARTATYVHRRKIILLSTPTTASGAISQAYAACQDRRQYELACPHCGVYAVPAFANIRWPKPDGMGPQQLAEHIVRERAAFYACSNCGAITADAQRNAMLVHGRWSGSAGAARVGFHLPGIVSPWRSFSDAAAEFIMAADDPPAQQHFRNSYLGEPVSEVVVTTAPSEVKAHATGPRTVPPWTTGLFATADVQHDRFYLTIRAWGPQYRSRLLHACMVLSFEELGQLAFGSAFPTEDGRGSVSPQLLMIDSGDRSDEVYNFSKRDPRIYCSKGASQAMTKPWYPSRLQNGISLRIFDSGYYKDLLARLMAHQDKTWWQIPTDSTEDYMVQMRSERKVFDRKRRREVWAPVSSGAANHYWDCEVLQCHVADASGVTFQGIALQPALPQPAVAHIQQPVVAAPRVQPAPLLEPTSVTERRQAARGMFPTSREWMNGGPG